MTTNQRLRIAIQKSGRLSQDCCDLLAKCGVKAHMQTQRLIVMAENMPIEILRVRDDDIPGLVMDGVVDLGIVGECVLDETVLMRAARGAKTSYELLKRLDFGECRLSLAIPNDQVWTDLSCLEGKRIATSFPYLLKRFFDNEGVQVNTCVLTGSVEIATRAGLADAICDQVSTGATLEANGLKEVFTMVASRAMLIKRTDINDESKQALIERLLARIQGVVVARESKYIMLHAPKSRIDDVVALLPGAEHPTLLELSGDPDRVAMHMVSSETLFWETMEKLKAVGASSILVLPIEKMLE